MGLLPGQKRGRNNEVSRPYVVAPSVTRKCEYVAPVVRNGDNAMHLINHYPADRVICFVKTYPLDSIIQHSNNRGLVS